MDGTVLEILTSKQNPSGHFYEQQVKLFKKPIYFSVSAETLQTANKLSSIFKYQTKGTLRMEKSYVNYIFYSETLNTVTHFDQFDLR